MPYTHAQMVSQALTPKASAFLSYLGSVAMLFEILAANRSASSSSTDNGSGSGQNRAVNRLLAGMCIADMSFSAGWFLTTWPSPKENSSWLWGASGNTQTCTAQGFFISLGFWSVPLYNTVVSFYFWAIIGWNWTEERLLRYDKFVHGAIWSAVLLRSFLYLAYEYFNAYGVICYVTALPMGCMGDECIRGDENTWKVGIFEQIFPIWLCLILNSVLMARIYAAVRKVALRAKDQARHSTTAQWLLNKKKDIKVQALLYVLAMYFCLVPDQIYALIYFLSAGRSYSYYNFWFETFVYMALPLQGYLNFVVFMRRQRRAHTLFARVMIAPLRWCIMKRSSVIKGKRAEPMEDANAEPMEVSIVEPPLEATTSVEGSASVGVGENRANNRRSRSAHEEWVENDC